MKAVRRFCSLAMVLIALGPIAADAQAPDSPEDFFGHQMGADYKLARWDRIVEYFRHLDSASERISVVELGASTLGEPFLLAVISSAENLANLDRIKEVNRRLANPLGLSAAQIAELAGEGRFTLAVTNSLHSTEVGGTQMAPELAWELVTSEEPPARLVRENCVLLLFPCFNPDGQVMVTDWYNEHLGTEYDGARLPYLYHSYCGHDNNRDGYMITQAESRHVSRVLYNEFFPQAYIDHHHFGSYGARLYIPPYFDPIHANVDPLLWREHLLYGAMMAMRLEMEGKTGIETGAPFTAWWMASFHMITNYHNITGMLTESASAELATPKFIHPHQLGPNWRGRPEYMAQVNFPHPWPGGWWRLRDVVEQMKISTLAALELGARNRQALLRSAALKSLRQIELGRSEPPFAYIVPPGQHDDLTALKMLETLMRAGVEVHRAEEPLEASSVVYPAGTYLVRLDQPLRAYVKSLMEQVRYPDNDWTRYRDGSPMSPYDLAAFTLAEHMGVRVEEVVEPLEGRMSLVRQIEFPQGRLVGDGSAGFVLDSRLNDAATAVNRVLAAGGRVWRLAGPLTTDGFDMPPGAFFIRAPAGELEEIALDLHLTMVAPVTPIAGEALALSRPRLGLYQRYQGGNSDEGWTRWVLEQFEFEYETLMSDRIREAGGAALAGQFDVIIIPSDRLSALLGPDYDNPQPGDRPVPPQFRSGLGEEGVEALRGFVEAGGMLVTLDSACQLALEKLELPIGDVTTGLSSTQFFCPGSTLHTRFDTSHPLAYGMPGEGLVLNWQSPAFAVRPTLRNEDYSVAAGYPEEGLLRSGWLLGERVLANKASLVEARLGEGSVVLFGMRPQLRAQMHGTFKLLFNAIFLGAAERVELQ